MRRPLIFFLIAISVYAWLADCVNFIFYILKINVPNIKLYCSIISLLLIAGTFFVIRKKIARSSSLPTFKDLFRYGTKQEWLLLLGVSMPVLILGILRAVYPDQNYDTFHYELYLQEFNFNENSVNFAPGSLRAYFFPLGERIYAILRHLLGYRMGTILNTFLLIVIIFSVYDLFKKVFSVYFANIPFPKIAVVLLSLFAIFAENTLFIIGSYKTDLLGVPLILELLHIIFFRKHTNNKRFQHLYFFLIASLTISYKLTYLPYTGIITLIYLAQHRKTLKPTQFILLPLLILIFPGLYLLYNLLETGNPVFPLYNDIFQSKLFSLERFKDHRWGHRNIYEIFTYHFVTYMDKARANEWSLYSFRLPIGYVVSLFTIIIYFIRFGKNKQNPFFQFIVVLSIIAILFDYSCVITTGYFRYGSIVEILYGTILGLLFLYFSQRIAALFVFSIIFLQSYDTFDNIYVKNINLSWHDYPHLVKSKKILKNNLRLMFNDYDRVKDENNILPRVVAFVNPEPYPQDGLAKLLKKDAVIYDLQPGSRTDETTNQAMSAIRVRAENEMFVTVASIEALQQGIVKSLNTKGFLVSEMHEVYPSFFRFGEPVFILRIKYQDTAKYNIKTIEQYLRDENPAGQQNQFLYNTGNSLKAFIREAPFAFTWDFLPQEYDITINGEKHVTKDRFDNNKIFSIAGTELKIEKPNSVPYLLIIQEIEEKKKP